MYKNIINIIDTQIISSLIVGLDFFGGNFLDWDNYLMRGHVWEDFFLEAYLKDADDVGNFLDGLVEDSLALFLLKVPSPVFIFFVA